MKRHKIVFQTNYSRLSTGLGKNLRSILKYLYKTGKYDIVEFAAGYKWSDPKFARLPWKGYGTLPDSNKELAKLNEDPLVIKSAQYGTYSIDKLIKLEKPTIWMGIEDFWAFSGYWDRYWWNKINTVLHTTIDALPVLPEAVEFADKIPNFLVWSEFAEKEFHKEGKNHVKTLHGVFDHKDFYPASLQEKNELRKLHNIPEDAFVIIDVFRNQARKQVYTLLEGYAMWKKENPDVKSYLLLVTNTNEGWNISKFAKEFGIDQKEILYTYICSACGEFEISSEKPKNSDCKFCGAKKSVNTISVKKGITENQLRDCYAVSDIMVHAFKNGGQELPIQEAKLCELPTAVTNYSCGADMCVPEAHSYPLEYSVTREFKTEFINAQTDPVSVFKAISYYYNMGPEERSRLGALARKWVIDNYSIEVIGKQLEAMFDAMEIKEWDYDFSADKKNDKYPFPDIADDTEFVLDLYKNMLNIDESKNGDGCKHWTYFLESGKATKQDVYRCFVQEAIKENTENIPFDFKTLFDDNGKKRGLFVMKESGGDIFILTSLFKSFKNLYPDHDLYVAVYPQFASILHNNPYIHKVLNYMPEMESEMFMTGHADHKGFVDVVYYPFLATQRHLSYLSRDKIDFEINNQENGFKASFSFPFESL